MGRGGGRGGSGAAVGRRRRRTYLQSTGDSRSISKTPCLVRPRGPVPVARGQEASFTRFHRLRRAPLSEEQQREALEQRLGTAQASRLLPYLEQIPRDLDSGQPRHVQPAHALDGRIRL